MLSKVLRLWWFLWLATKCKICTYVVFSSQSVLDRAEELHNSNPVWSGILVWQFDRCNKTHRCLEVKSFPATCFCKELRRCGSSLNVKPHSNYIITFTRDQLREKVTAACWDYTLPERSWEQCVYEGDRLADTFWRERVVHRDVQRFIRWRRCVVIKECAKKCAGVVVSLLHRCSTLRGAISENLCCVCVVSLLSKAGDIHLACSIGSYAVSEVKSEAVHEGPFEF